MSNSGQTRRDFVSDYLFEYYQKAVFSIPSLNKREFGVGRLKKIDSRHLSFASETEFRAYLASNLPPFVSHSTSYYDFPGATPMEKKIRTGADLVFDLDLHSETKYGVYEMLGKVKEDLTRLVKDFVIGDFGVKKENVVVVFSGNRGYHVHVREKEWLGTGSDERKELVDYILGHGLDYTAFFTPGEKGRLMGPKPSEGGYRGRLARAVVRTATENPSAISRIFKQTPRRDLFIKSIENGNWSGSSFDNKDLLAKIKGVAAELPISSVDTDAGVTYDLSKLIRVPNSIHGDTGMIAKIVPLDGLESFEPLRDAFFMRTGNGEIKKLKITFSEDVPAIGILGQTAGPFVKGQTAELEEPVAIFFVLRKSAVFVS